MKPAPSEGEHDDTEADMAEDVAAFHTAAKSVDPSEVTGSVFPPVKERPCWRVYDDWVEHQSRRYQPGVYRHSMTEAKADEPPREINIWICSPLYLMARTHDQEDNEHGTLLRFFNKSGNWRTWAMPDEMLAGSGEEVRREVMAMGLRIAHKQRGLFNEYLQSRVPKARVICTSSTGWLGRDAFVLPGEVIGPGASGVVLQTGSRVSRKHGIRGTLDGWKAGVSAYAIGNPMVMFGISCSFVGPILDKTNQEGGGVHYVGGSSCGKTTVLEGARSTWGGPEQKRSWRATANGVEGVAEMHNDLLLAIDEISEVEPREAGAIAYMLSNGQGKSRATRTGGAREAKRWRVFVFSTGERTLAATMSEGRIAAKAGQGVRLLDIPAERKFGVFDDLRGLGSGRALSDAIKNAAKEHYGVAGRAFLERLTVDRQDLGEALDAAKRLPELQAGSGQEGRAAARFALVAVAGELATAYGVTGWPEGAAIEASIEAFRCWCRWRGAGDDEPRKIRDAARRFLELHGGSRFIDFDAERDLYRSQLRHTRDRAGYWRNTETGDRIYLVNSAAMQEIARGFDLKAVVAELVRCGALERESARHAAKLFKPHGEPQRLYVIHPQALEAASDGT